MEGRAICSGGQEIKDEYEKRTEAEKCHATANSEPYDHSTKITPPWLIEKAEDDK